MALNCKPGDLAVCIYAPLVPAMVGRIFKVTKVEMYLGFPHWHTEPEQRDPKDGLRVMFCDDDIRPIRDPGEDAKDETLEWLPVPEKVTA